LISDLILLEELFFTQIIPPEAKQISLQFPPKNGLTCIFSSVTSSSFTSEARDLKIDMHIPHMEGFKVTNQIFDIFLPRS